jgi:hypothetical protein
VLTSIQNTSGKLDIKEVRQTQYFITGFYFYPFKLKGKNKTLTWLTGVFSPRHGAAFVDVSTSVRIVAAIFNKKS